MAEWQRQNGSAAALDAINRRVADLSSFRYSTSLRVLMQLIVSNCYDCGTHCAGVVQVVELRLERQRLDASAGHCHVWRPRSPLTATRTSTCAGLGVGRSCGNLTPSDLAPVTWRGERERYCEISFIGRQANLEQQERLYSTAFQRIRHQA